MNGNERRRAADATVLLWLIWIAVMACIGIMLAGCENPISQQEPTFASTWQWGHTPVLVEANPGVDWDREIDAAINAWNDFAGCMLFERGSGDVTIAIGDDHETHKGWTELYAIGNRITRAEVTLHGVADSGQAYRVIMHELGRSVALEGSLWPEPESSFMHNAIAGRTRFPVLVTWADAKAVAWRYCQ